MKKPVIAIGLMRRSLIVEAWMSQTPEESASSTRPGAYTRLNNPDYYRAETPWTTFLTGCLPEKTGYWAPVKLREGIT